MSCIRLMNFVLCRSQRHRHIPELYTATSVASSSVFSRSTSSEASTSTKNDSEKKDLRLAFTTYPMKNGDPVVEVDEKKKQILILHGLFGARGNFHSICKHLSKDGRKAIPYDCRNHGDSDHHPEMNYSAMAQDAISLTSSLGLTSPVILGHSMGGKTAMTAALSQPDLWTGLIVADVAPQNSPQILGLKAYAEAMKKVKVNPGQSIVKARTQARTQLASVIEEKSILEFLLTNLKEFGPKSINWRFNLDAMIDQMEEIAKFSDLGAQPFTKPTLFVFGEKSDHYKNADMGVIKALFPNVVIEVIPGAGHFVHAEKPLEFVEIVNSFVEPMDS